MHKNTTTVVVVGVDGRTSEDLENSRLREYAKASGPAGAGMAEGEEGKSLTDMAKEYGQGIMDMGSDIVDAQMSVLFGDGGNRTRESADPLMDTGVRSTPSSDGGFTMMIPLSGGQKIDPSLLDDVQPIDDQYGRSPDMVLMDWMGDEDEVDSKFLSDMYPSDERIDYLARSAGGEQLTPVIPGSVREMSQNMRDYNRFGGDVVAMELDRDEIESSGGIYDAGKDESMLRALMESNVKYADIQDADEGLVAIREDLGPNVDVVLLSKDGTKAIYSAYSPKIGRLKYSYDSASGVGRILGKQ